MRVESWGSEEVVVEKRKGEGLQPTQPGVWPETPREKLGQPRSSRKQSVKSDEAEKVLGGNGEKVGG